ncbi:hypothetical protein NEHOM01_1735 [Nematocida homosporus]|uniref:uncharacterized protein n=1 Tax=Nematocida homosporus TaxID=1912981 RepID=UPI00221F9586|nr:uncharacterized protein NEHOM01_1735 [Nematocida homosporus]KAI5186834.1 hypothetical protein NEHOM01_1735 [Nematocida homosporus]
MQGQLLFFLGLLALFSAQHASAGNSSILSSAALPPLSKLAEEPELIVDFDLSKPSSVVEAAETSSVPAVFRFPKSSKPYKLGIFTTYKPTVCGIAQFSENMIKGLLKAAPNVQIEVFNAVRCPPGPPRVSKGIKIRDVYCMSSYEVSEFDRLANYIAQEQFDGVLINHEFGIIGNHAHFVDLLKLLKRTKADRYTMIHTPMSYPAKEQRAHLRAVATHSTNVFVMSWKAKHYLHHTYGIPEHKIVYFPHGISRRTPSKAVLRKFGLAPERFIIYCDGILHPNKGIDRIIKALAILKDRGKIDNILLLVAGTNSKNGRYMQRAIYPLIRRHRLEKHFRWIPRFLTNKEMATLHKRANIYLTLFNEVIPTSGTLTYAMYAGDAIISTPYRYSLELLGVDNHPQHGTNLRRMNALRHEKKVIGYAGVSVPFANPEHLADAILDIKNNPELSQTLEKNALHRTKGYSWTNVARHIAHFLQTKEAVALNPDPYKNCYVPSSCAWTPHKITSFFTPTTIKNFPDGYYLIYLDSFVKITGHISNQQIKRIFVQPRQKPNRTSKLKRKTYHNRSKTIQLTTSPHVSLENSAKNRYTILTPNIAFEIRYLPKSRAVSFVVLYENIHGCASGMLGCTLRQKYDLTKPPVPQPSHFRLGGPFHRRYCK